MDGLSIFTIVFFSLENLESNTFIAQCAVCNLEQSGKITLCIAELFWEQEHVLRVTEHLSKRRHFDFGPFDWEPHLTRQGPHLTWLGDQTTFDQ